MSTDYVVDWVPLSLASTFHEVRTRWTKAEVRALAIAEAEGSAVWARYPPGGALHKVEIWVWMMLELIGADNYIYVLDPGIQYLTDDLGNLFYF